MWVPERALRPLTCCFATDGPGRSADGTAADLPDVLQTPGLNGAEGQLGYDQGDRDPGSASPARRAPPPPATPADEWDRPRPDRRPYLTAAGAPSPRPAHKPRQGVPDRPPRSRPTGDLHRGPAARSTTGSKTASAPTSCSAGSPCSWPGIVETRATTNGTATAARRPHAAPAPGPDSGGCGPGAAPGCSACTWAPSPAPPASSARPPHPPTRPAGHRRGVHRDDRATPRRDRDVSRIGGSSVAPRTGRTPAPAGTPHPRPHRRRADQPPDRRRAVPGGEDSQELRLVAAAQARLLPPHRGSGPPDGRRRAGHRPLSTPTTTGAVLPALVTSRVARHRLAHQPGDRNQVTRRAPRSLAHHGRRSRRPFGTANPLEAGPATRAHGQPVDPDRRPSTPTGSATAASAVASGSRPRPSDAEQHLRIGGGGAGDVVADVDTVPSGTATTMPATTRRNRAVVDEDDPDRGRPSVKACSTSPG